MILLLDNFDSFTYNLADYLQQLNLEVDVLRNNVPRHHLMSDKYKAVVLSPGPGTPQNSGLLMEAVAYYVSRVPVLGICLGQQAIAAHFNGRIQRAEKPIHGKISTIMVDQDALFTGLPRKIDVVRYHSLICADLPENMKCIALAENSEIMAIKHNYLPVYGLQFHPEAYLTMHGLRMLENWRNISLGCFEYFSN